MCQGATTASAAAWALAERNTRPVIRERERERERRESVCHPKNAVDASYERERERRESLSHPKEAINARY